MTRSATRTRSTASASHRGRRLCLALAVSLLLAGCASTTPGDPLEPLNRIIFKGNDKLDEYVATPISKGYRAVTPQPLRTAISNFFNNLADVGNTVNNLLQGKGVAAMESLMRVAINSTFGLGGLLDIATPAGLQKHSEDFGLTLGTWGVPSGPYIVLPLFGPSSFRDGAGLYVNFQLDPLTYARPAVRNSLYGLEFVSIRTSMLGATDLLSEAALDRYSFVRDAYQQQRLSQIQHGKGPRRLPQYEDYGDPDTLPDAKQPAAPGLPASPDDGAPAPVAPPSHGEAASAPAATVSGVPNQSSQSIEAANSMQGNKQDASTGASEALPATPPEAHR